jgi:ribosomal protein S27AE
MQIAGSSCEVCGRSVTFSVDGKFCARCGTVMHLGCEPRASCGVCGQPFQSYEQPKAEPLNEALVPRSLRPVGSGGAALAMCLGAGLLLLGIMVMLWFQQITAHGGK